MTATFSGTIISLLAICGGIALIVVALVVYRMRGRGIHKQIADRLQRRQ